MQKNVWLKKTFSARSDRRIFIYEFLHSEPRPNRGFDQKAIDIPVAIEKRLVSVFVGNTGCICGQKTPLRKNSVTNGIESSWMWLNFNPPIAMTINLGLLPICSFRKKIIMPTAHMTTNTINTVNVMYFIIEIAIFLGEIFKSDCFSKWTLLVWNTMHLQIWNEW